MRRAFFFIVALLSATTSFASIPRARTSADASALLAPSSETRVMASDVLAPFERRPESGLTRTLRQAYEQSGATKASGSVRFLSVDPVLDVEKATHAPQMWNRYAYVTNNPLRFTDPTGKYVCHGTDAECKNIETGLHKMQESADHLKKNDPRRAELNKVIKAYGKAGDPKSQISAVWVNPTKQDGTPLLKPGTLGQAGRNGNLFLSFTNIGNKAQGDSATAFTILGGVMSHEGKHELQPAVVGLEGRPSFLSMIFYERQAYAVEQGYYEGAGKASMATDPTAGAFGSAAAGCNTPLGCNP